jgi:hypothetical protein
MSHEVRFCPNGHPSDDVGRCLHTGCAYCDPIVTKTTRKKDGINMGPQGVRRPGRRK